MQFKPELIEAMRDGRKTQTRRVKREGERILWSMTSRKLRDINIFLRSIPSDLHHIPTVAMCGTSWINDYGETRWVVNRIKCQVGRRYTINPPPSPGDRGRMGKAVGSFECVGLRVERLQAIGISDARTEIGWSPEDPFGWFRELWDSIAKKGERWADNPTVWVIEMGEFEWEGE